MQGIWLEFMDNFLDKICVKLMVWHIKKGFGANCPSPDYVDHPEDLKQELTDNVPRCPSCRAQDVIEWLEESFEPV